MSSAPEGIVVIFRAVKRLSGDGKTSGQVEEHSTGGPAGHQADGIVKRLDGGAGLAGAGGDVDVAIVFKIEVVGGTNHGEDFAGSRFGDESGAITDF